uniref:Aminopeptidase n=1 Tax=Gasterosteus aculeatus aculeatus TaxID=481459 RepID=A0AAQ4RZZ8_GASAC
MGKVYYVSRNVGLGMLVLAVTALVTIIALSVAYDKARAENGGEPGDAAASGTSAPARSPTPSAPEEPWDHYRLPDALLPVTYNVTLWPRLKPDASGLYVFTGRSAVVIRCVKETDLIIIHSNKLNLTGPHGHHAALSGLGEAIAPAIQRSWLVVETQYLVIQLHGRLAAGASYVLSTEFKGELADDLEGFYRSEYTEGGVTKVVATSQMQATYARKTFPCFDEPAMKAVFNITVIHEPNTIALSNDDLIDGEPVRVTTFEPTMRMSSYLLAFIVSDFDSIKSTMNNGLLIRIWARRKAIEDKQGNYALNITGSILQFYESYYNATYPLSKSDQIALPDFHAGAMENWGLITYRETALLFDPIMSSTGNKERITTVISHELAHMWFGNLVTMKWWNDLWLNEGFASYVEYLGADHAEPTWSMKDQIILHEVHKVFAMDSLASSHPLSRGEEEVNTPAQISGMFNSISYSKGAAVLRMLSEFLTEPVFAKGLSSVSVFQLHWQLFVCCQAVESTPGVHIPHTVHDIMNRWVLQMGFPVVTIDTRTGSITQKHFLLDPNSVVNEPSQFNYTWFVPIKWTKTGVEQQQYWLLQETVSGEDWVLANTNVAGYFRVNYDLDNWNRLLSQLNTDHQGMINRAQIIDDAFNLARAKLINITLALKTTKYLSKERLYIPWKTALINFNYFILMFDRTEVYGALQTYLKKQIQPLFEHFRTITANWTNIPSGHNDHSVALRTGCMCGEKVCVFASDFLLYCMCPLMLTRIHPNLKSTVYCTAIAFGGVEEWDFAWRMFKNATLASEASRLRAALACTKAPWLLNRYLEYTLDPTKIRKQDATSTIGYIAKNTVGMPLTWNFVRARWKYLFEEYGQGSFSFFGLINGITTRFSTEFELQELKQFKEDNLHVGFGSGIMALEQAIEKTKANIQWVAENKVHVMNWLTEESR